MMKPLCFCLTSSLTLLKHVLTYTHNKSYSNVVSKLVNVFFFSQKYVAVGELGKATDTLDATGSVVLEKDFGKHWSICYRNSLCS